MMTYTNNIQLRKWLNDCGMSALAGMESFELSRAEYDKHLRDVGKRPVSEREDAAAFRCLTTDRVPQKEKAATPLQIFAQQDQFLKVQASHQEEMKSRHGAVMVGVDSIRGDVAKLSDVALQTQQKCEELAAFTEVTDQWHDLTTKKLVAMEERIEISGELYLNGLNELGKRFTEMQSRQFPRWAQILIFVVLGLLIGADIAFGQNVNPSIVVATCGTPPSPYPSAGSRAPNTVNVNGEECGAVTISGSVIITSGTVTANQGTSPWVSSLSTALPSGTNGIGKLTANSGVDIGDVTIDNAVGNAVPVQILGMFTNVSGNITSSVNASVSVALVTGTASNYLYITGCSFNNTHASVDTLVYLQDGNDGNTIWVTTAPHGGGSNISFPMPGPLKVPTSGNSLYFKPATAGAAVTGACTGGRSTTSY